jgi:hypothetical protein
MRLPTLSRAFRRAFYLGRPAIADAIDSAVGLALASFPIYARILTGGGPSAGNGRAVVHCAYGCQKENQEETDEENCAQESEADQESAEGEASEEEGSSEKGRSEKESWRQENCRRENRERR